MTLGEFREMTKDLDNDVVMHIANDGYEWYGTENMNKDAWEVSNADLIFNFHNLGEGEE